MPRILTTILLVTFLLGLALPVAAQPAPPPPECPEGEVYSPELDACVPPDQLPPTPTPVDTGESSLPVPAEPDTDEEVEDAMANGDMGVLNSFTIQHFACATGFDPAANAGRWTGLRTNCTGDGTPAFPYTIYEEGATLASPTLTSGGGSWGEQRYVSDQQQDFFILGRLSVSVQPPAGWYLAFVTCQTSRGGSTLATFNPPVSDNSAFIDEGRVGSDLSCAFFVAQTGGGSQATGNVETGEAAVTITVRNCPAGTTAESDLATTCTGTDNRVTFRIQTETETIDFRTTDTTGIASLTFPGDTEVAVTEDLPSGYGQPIVRCAGTVQDVLFGNQIRVTVPAGSILKCQWYDIPTDGPDNGPSIFLRPVDCGTIRPDEILENALAACTASMANVTFDVTLDDELIADDVAPTGPDALVFLTKLPISELGSEFIVTANLPRGASSQRAFCDRGTQGDGFTTIDPQFQGNTIAAWADPGQSLRCTWFFRTSGTGAQVPGEEAAPAAEGVEAGIAIAARLCPYEVVTSRVDWNVVCTEPGAGVTATLTRDGALFLSLQTGVDGTLPMPPDPPTGTYVLTAATPAGMLGPQIDCAIQAADGTTTGSSAFQPDQPEGATFTWDGASSIQCTIWLVIDDAANTRGGGQGLVADAEPEAAEADPPGAAASTLTVQLWLCPVGVDIAASQEVLLATCATDLEARTVTVTRDGETAAETVTGKASWTATDGIFVLDPGPGALAGTVWCSATWVANGQEYGQFPEVVPLDAGAFTYTAANAGSTIYCDWFLAAA